MWRRIADDAGRRLDLAGPPQRIASLVPSVTELICHLGAVDRLIAATRFCSEPAALPSRIARIGGTKTPACQRLLALRPDLVVLNSEENRREDFEALLAAGVPVFVSFTSTVAGAADAVERLGAGLGADAPAAALAAAIRAARRAVVDGVAARRRVFCPIWRRPWMSFNRDTYCHDLLACAGGDNVCGDAAERYPRVDLQAIAAAAPEIILLPDEPYPFAERHRAALPDLACTPAAQSGQTHLLDGKALSWYGPRTPAALTSIAALMLPPP
jgi:ABC-type hemin transport system substrate-binding protein